MSDLGQDFWIPGINEEHTEYRDLIFHPQESSFKENQNADISISGSGQLFLEVRQDHSTPGLKVDHSIHLDPGDYEIEVSGEASVGGTFFPWVIEEKTKLRLTPTIHLTTFNESVSAPFSVDKKTTVVIGVLSHNQEIGDKCIIQRLAIKKVQETQIESKGNYNLISADRFLPHQSTILSIDDGILVVRSQPRSTPGAFAIIDVNPETKISIRCKASMEEGCIGFLYVSDADTNLELTNRNVIFRTKGEELYSFVEIPSGVSRVRVGILFSTVSIGEEYVMRLNSIEVVETAYLGELVDESYVLNLKNEIEKFKICEREARRHGISLQRWIAVNGYSSENMEDWRKYMDSPWSEYDSLLGRKAIDKPGAWDTFFRWKKYLLMHWPRSTTISQSLMMILFCRKHSLTTFQDLFNRLEMTGTCCTSARHNGHGMG